MSGTVLYNTSSAQFQALRWLAETDGLQLPALVGSQQLVERYLLALFYFSTNDASWFESFNFLDNVSACEWRRPNEFSNSGVRCNGFQSISALGLGAFGDIVKCAFPRILLIISFLFYTARNKMQGSIPFELGYLSNLEELYLSFNDMTGKLLSELGNLTQLRFLYLNRNSFSKSLPTELGNLVQLTDLSLEASRVLGRIPIGFGNLVALQRLYLSGKTASLAQYHRSWEGCRV